jgi:hypothetical protein
MRLLQRFLPCRLVAMELHYGDTVIALAFLGDCYWR